MPSNTAASMFGGAGGRGSRVSVASLEGLRNVLRNETEKDSAPAPPKPVADLTPAAPAAPPAPADDKKTLRGLNDRLSGYLGRVRQLEKENGDLQKQIDDILAKRETPEGRNWDAIEKPLEDLKKQIKDITMDNAKLLLQIDNTKLADDDFKNKLKDESKARKELEKDVEDLKKTIEDTKLNRQQTQKEIDLVKGELDRLEKEHKEEVDALCEKIKNSVVTVEIDSKNSNLSEKLNNIRVQYDKLAQKNIKDTEDWYQSKFENIKVVEAQNNEDLQSGKTELKELIKRRQTLEIKIQSLHSMIYNLEETLRSTKAEYGMRLGPLNKVIRDLEAELTEVRSQVERLVENNNNLLCVKMKLEAEIAGYQRLIHGMTADVESLEFAIKDALGGDQQKPDGEVPKQQEVQAGKGAKADKAPATAKGNINKTEKAQSNSPTENKK
ncbi:keratin, type I cytoskeletal 18 isoform X1 [Morone saxatilis]|uniref:keratin, type I cytoskeletal 18 isoform X1 n=1 Tax=Morone saxatilis TaxID=34816 RepID=UPI0015E2269F|nr:keratin, type I cytoskeletal 18 isoform X1 [Morone saxatilis]